MSETVHLYVFDTMADYEVGYAAAWINNPMFQANPGRYRVVTVGSDTTPVVSMGGLRIIPDLSLEELTPERSVMLILPGGISWDEGKNLDAVNKAADFLETGVTVAAICGATAALARAGLLEDRLHTSNAPEYLAASGYHGEDLYQHQPAVTDGNLITAGAVGALDFACHIVKKLEVYSSETLESWFGLFKTGDPAYFTKLMQG